MTLVASGICNEPKALLRDSLAECTALLARLNRTPPETAADRIFYNEWVNPSDADPPAPLLVIATPEGSPIYETIAGGDQLYLAPNANHLVLELFDARRYPETPVDDAIDFENFASALIEYLADKAGQDAHLDITRIAWKVPPHTTGPTRRQALEGYWSCSWDLTWGLDG